MKLSPDAPVNLREYAFQPHQDSSSQARTGRRLTLPIHVYRSHFNAVLPQAKPTSKSANIEDVQKPLALGITKVVNDKPPALPAKRSRKSASGTSKASRKNSAQVEEPDDDGPEVGVWLGEKWVADPAAEENFRPMQADKSVDRSVIVGHSPSQVAQAASSESASQANLSRAAPNSTGLAISTPLPPGRQELGLLKRRLPDTPRDGLHTFSSSHPLPSTPAYSSLYVPAPLTSSSADRHDQSLFMPGPDDELEIEPENPADGLTDGRFQNECSSLCGSDGEDEPESVRTSRRSEPTTHHRSSQRQAGSHPPRPLRSQQRENTYSRRVPKVHRSARTSDDRHDVIGEDALEDGISYNEDLIRRRVQPSQAQLLSEVQQTRPSRLTVGQASQDDFVRLVTDPHQSRSLDRMGVSRSPSLAGAGNESFEWRGQFDDDHWHTYEDEDEDEEHCGPLHVYDDDLDVSMRTPEDQILPEHQQAVDRLFTSSPGYRGPHDPNTFRRLSERLAIDTSHAFPLVPTQKEQTETWDEYERRSRRRRKYRRDRKRSKHRRLKHYHDRRYAGEPRHRYRSHSTHRHREHSDSGSGENDCNDPRQASLRMSRRESVAPKIERWIENARPNNRNTTQEQYVHPATRPLRRVHRHSVSRKRPDRLLQAAKNVPPAFLPGIATVKGEQKRDIMLQRSRLESYPVEKHLIESVEKDIRRLGLESLTKTGRKTPRTKTGDPPTRPRPLPPRLTLARPDDDDLGSTGFGTITDSIQQFTPSHKAQRRYNPAKVVPLKPKIPQLKFVRDTSPASASRRKRTERIVQDHLTPHQGPLSESRDRSTHSSSQAARSYVRPATPVDNLIPTLRRVPIGVGVRLLKTPEQRSADLTYSSEAKTPSSARIALRVLRDAQDQSMLKGLTAEEVERLTRELSMMPGAKKGCGSGMEATEDTSAGSALEPQPFPHEMGSGASGLQHGDGDVDMMDPVTRLSPKIPSRIPASTGTSDPVSIQTPRNTLTRQDISDAGQNLADVLRALTSNQASALGPDGRQSSGRRPRRQERVQRGGSKKQSTLDPFIENREPGCAQASFMKKLLPDGPQLFPRNTQEEASPSEANQDQSAAFEVHIAKPRGLILEGFEDQSNNKRLGRHPIESLPRPASQGQSRGSAFVVSRGVNRGIASTKTAPSRLGLGKPHQCAFNARPENDPFSMDREPRSRSAVTQPYKNPTTPKTPGKIRESQAAMIISPTQRTTRYTATQTFDRDEEDEEPEQGEEEEEEDREQPAAPFVYSLQETASRSLQRSLALPPGRQPSRARGSRPTRSRRIVSAKFKAPAVVNRQAMKKDSARSEPPTHTKPSSHGQSLPTQSLGHGPLRYQVFDDEMDLDHPYSSQEEEEYEVGEPLRGLDHFLGLVELPSAEQSSRNGC
ncbi:hypothetical protein BD324DRAFT_653533 [Kockovaella imperatae]|uniref:Uncharacterized protein n=1 Tax=Kockovaella imperatae TaxID=4999 RepID=A0A1Y1UB05_9TREE|nr:hypothetical protein BD324DRAFT_653533 [Kockovaella imperatae]ORX34265.1 hypothetical protein BD324DRAFT_653533 [Kockovaella imperatae]